MTDNQHTMNYAGLGGLFGILLGMSVVGCHDRQNMATQLSDLRREHAAAAAQQRATLESVERRLQEVAKGVGTWGKQP